KTGYAMLATNSGLIVAGQGKQNGKLTLAQMAKKTGDKGWNTIAKAVKTGRGGQLQVKDLKGRKLTVFYQPLNTAEDWGMLVAAPTNEVLGTVSSLRTRLLIGSLIGLLLIALAVWFIATRLTRPLGDFVRGLRS